MHPTIATMHRLSTTGILPCPAHREGQHAAREREETEDQGAPPYLYIYTLSG